MLFFDFEYLSYFDHRHKALEVLCKGSTLLKCYLSLLFGMYHLQTFLRQLKSQPNQKECPQRH